MPPAAAVPPSPAQHATEDITVSGLLQVLERQRENLDRMATTARANTEAITHLSSDFEKMMYTCKTILNIAKKSLRKIIGMTVRDKTSAKLSSVRRMMNSVK